MRPEPRLVDPEPAAVALIAGAAYASLRKWRAGRRHAGALARVSLLLVLVLAAVMSSQVWSSLADLRPFTLVYVLSLVVGLGAPGNDRRSEHVLTPALLCMLLGMWAFVFVQRSVLLWR